MQPLTKDETREAMRYARLAVEYGDGTPEANPLWTLRLARLVLLLIERGQRMTAVYAAALDYARRSDKVGDALAWKALRDASMAALAAEQADEVST